MRRWFFSILNLYIYSSLHIGLAAAALCYLSQEVITSAPDRSYLLFAFVSTILLYNLHRIIGIKKLEGQPDLGRFKIIRTYWYHILIYAIIALIGTLYYFFQLSYQQWLLLLIPAAVSALYVLPVLSNALRLRDLPYIKIFLIAITWAVITVTIPLASSTLHLSVILAFTIERIFFIFAITLPFDWRDEEIDKISGVRTMVHYLGKSNSLRLALGLLAICAMFILIFFITGQLPLEVAISFIVTYFLTGMLIYKFRASKSDYIYSGWIDGSMILPFIIYEILISI